MENKESGLQQLADSVRTRRTFIPRADIWESADAICLLADMPGVDESKVDITLEKNILTIIGSVEPEVPQGYKLAYSEYGIGDYKRVFTLSNEIDKEGIEASVKNGVLKLRLPKSKEVLPKKIAIKAE
jgi:HSP20 family molecular chaperone IbpA